MRLMKIYCIYLERIMIILILIFLSLYGCIKGTVTSPDDYPSDGKGYPRLAMWWPSTWNQPVNDLKRYDWIGFGEWENIETVNKLKTLNPNQKHFMDYSITETSWSEWEDNRIVMQKIPSEWFLTQRGTLLAQAIDASQTTVFVETVIDDNGTALFETGDNITCDLETMKVVDVNAQDNTITVERGFIRWTGFT